MKVIIEGRIIRAGWLRRSGLSGAVRLRFTLKKRSLDPKYQMECEVDESAASKMAIDSMRDEKEVRVIGQLIRRVGGFTEYVEVSAVEVENLIKQQTRRAQIWEVPAEDGEGVRL